MSGRVVTLIPYSEDAAERVASIFGPFSAAALALAELKARRGAGQDVSLFSTGGSFVVGPTSPSDGSMTSEGVG